MFLQKIYLLKKDEGSKITKFLGKLSLNYQTSIFIITIVIMGLSIFGVSKLEVENSFINYFSKKTEIYKGMKLIDEQLGGTTPLEVILKFPEPEKKKLKRMMSLMIGVMKQNKIMKNIGSQKIKLIPLPMFIII